MNDTPITVQPQPTDVWVCLRTGVWNLTSTEGAPRLTRMQITILRGCLAAASETLDEAESGLDMSDLLGQTVRNG